MVRDDKTLKAIGALWIVVWMWSAPSQAEVLDRGVREQRQLRISAPVSPHFVGLELGHSGSGGHIEATLGAGRLLRSGGLFPDAGCGPVTRGSEPCSTHKLLAIDGGARLHLLTTSASPFVGAGIALSLSTGSSPSIESFMLRASVGLEWRHRSGFTADIALDAFLVSISIAEVERGFEALPAVHLGWAF